MSIRRQDIVSAIASRFSSINTGAGYHTNIGAHTFVWKATTTQDKDLPACIIRDITNTIALEGEGVPFSYHTHMLSIVAEIIVDSGATAETVTRQAIADVYRSIGTDDTWGGLALTSYLRDDEITFDEQQINKIIGASVRFDVEYRTNKYQENLS